MKDTRTDEELNRIVAEWIGWKPGHWVHWKEGLPQKFYDWGWTPPANLINTSVRFTPGKTSCEPPKYCTDLNEIHNAETNLEPVQLNKYGDFICDDCSDGTTGDPDIVQILLLGARRRAEALVHVIESTK